LDGVVTSSGTRSQARRATIDVTEAAAGQRLDRLLTGELAGFSRSRLQAIIREGAVQSNGRTIGDPGHRVKSGERIVVALPEAEPPEPKGEKIALNVLYEDSHIIVIDKPAGLVVHPAPGHREGTLVNALIAHCGESLSGIGGVKRPGIVHRLDKDTSGILVVAKTDAAHRGLAEQFSAHGADGRLRRAYLALVWGTFDRPSGMIDAPLQRSTRNRTKMMVTRRAEARHAVTHYEVLETFAGAKGKPVASLVRAELETGRTHQIRVHLAHIGHPVMGDPVYGSGFKSSAALLDSRAKAALERLGRQALHAANLGFEHPVTLRKLVFESPPPADMASLMAALVSKHKAAPAKRSG
jgi:23S rRNA pseudouridine1911/1915/1917 synthase